MFVPAQMAQDGPIGIPSDLDWFMLIRQATPADAAAIAHAQIEGWRTTYRGIVADELLDRMPHDERTAQWTADVKRLQVITFVAEDEAKRVVAFAACGPERTDRADYQGELYAIYILSECRGHGIGSQLVRRVAASLAESGKHGMLVWVFEDNPYRRFYESLGGKLLGKQPIEIGSQSLIEVAYGWDDLETILRPKA
jgi:L-amino acid N-acyltransferase YncA